MSHSFYALKKPKKKKITTKKNKYTNLIKKQIVSHLRSIQTHPCGCGFPYARKGCFDHESNPRHIHVIFLRIQHELFKFATTSSKLHTEKRSMVEICSSTLLFLIAEIKRLPLNLEIARSLSRALMIYFFIL